MSISEIKKGDLVYPSSDRHREVILKHLQVVEDSPCPPPWRVRFVGSGFIYIEEFPGGFFRERFKKALPINSNLEDYL